MVPGEIEELLGAYETGRRSSRWRSGSRSAPQPAWHTYGAHASSNPAAAGQSPSPGSWQLIGLPEVYVRAGPIDLLPRTFLGLGPFVQALQNALWRRFDSLGLEVLADLVLVPDLSKFGVGHQRLVDELFEWVIVTRLDRGHVIPIDHASLVLRVNRRKPRARGGSDVTVGEGVRTVGGGCRSPQGGSMDPLVVNDNMDIDERRALVTEASARVQMLAGGHETELTLDCSRVVTAPDAMLGMLVLIVRGAQRKGLRVVLKRPSARLKRSIIGAGVRRHFIW